MFAKIDEQWYAATYEFYRPGQACKEIFAENIGVHTRTSPMRDWTPQDGELVGFMVSGLARHRSRTVRRRSNVVLVRWGGDGTFVAYQ